MIALKKQQSWLFCLCCLHFFLLLFLNFHVHMTTCCKSVFINLGGFLSLHLCVMN